ncbi:MAG: hypothetical protein IJU23_04300 [Proteobacteria bacterium]|nr:hypothetical protein [Pseudomonadota bacterium]
MNKTQRFKYLSEYAIDRLCECFMDDFHKNMPDALHFVYHSKTYALICDKTTELYIQSPDYLYELLRHEYLYARLPFTETVPCSHERGQDTELLSPASDLTPDFDKNTSC